MKQSWLKYRLKQEAGMCELVSKDFHMDGSLMWRSQGEGIAVEMSSVRIW